MTTNDNHFVGKLANAMSDLYDNEAERVRVVDGVSKEAHLDFKMNEKVLGTWYMIAEFKNEAATSASDPYVQAVAYYLEATRTYAPNISGSTLPCFLLILFGQYSDFFACSISIHETLLQDHISSSPVLRGIYVLTCRYFRPLWHSIITPRIPKTSSPRHATWPRFARLLEL